MLNEWLISAIWAGGLFNFGHSLMRSLLSSAIAALSFIVIAGSVAAQDGPAAQPAPSSGEALESLVTGMADTERSIARSAEVLANWSLLQIGIVAAGVVAVIIIALQLMRIAAVSRVSAERQLRAYLQVECGGISQFDAEGIRGSVRVRNVGQTPAHDLTTVVHFFTEKLPITPQREKSIMRALKRATFVETDQTLNSDALKFSHVEATKTQVEAEPNFLVTVKNVADGTEAAIIAGYVRYRDVFRRPHISNFFHIYSNDRFKAEDGRHHARGNSAN